MKNSRSNLGPARQRGLILVLAVAGMILFVVGIETWLLLGLIGSFLVAGALVSHFEGRIERSSQLLLLLGAFLVGAFLALYGLAWNESWKRSCIPEGECAARHQFNYLETLDQQLFGFYDRFAIKPSGIQPGL
jgi:hypothetical protein